MKTKKTMFYIELRVPSLADPGNVDELLLYREVSSAMYRTKRSPVHRRIVER